MICQFCNKEFKDSFCLRRHQYRSKVCKGVRKVSEHISAKPENEVLRCLGGSLKQIKIIPTIKNNDDLDITRNGLPRGP